MLNFGKRTLRDSEPFIRHKEETFSVDTDIVSQGKRINYRNSETG